MDNSRLYSPTDLDIGEILETADQIFEALDIPEILVLATLESDDLLEDPIETGSEKSTRQPTRQLPRPFPTPSPTPSERSSSENYQTSETMSENRPMPEILLLPALGNTAIHRNEISGTLDSRNIIGTSRTRKSAHATALGNNSLFSGYHASFVTAAKIGPTTTIKPTHRDVLPPLPTS